MCLGKAITYTVLTHHPFIYVINHLHSGLLVLDLPRSSDNFLLSITVTHCHGHILVVIITGKCSTVETSVLNVTFHHYTQSYMLTCSKDPTVAFFLIPPIYLTSFLHPEVHTFLYSPHCPVRSHTLSLVIPYKYLQLLLLFFHNVTLTNPNTR